MMVGNLIQCEKCGRELQPENLKVGTNEKGELLGICGFCGNEVKVQ